MRYRPRLHSVVSMLVLTLLACLPMVGCSQRAAFRDAASPLGINIYGDLTSNYISALPPESPDRAVQDMKAQQFLAAIQEGDAAATASVWFGVGNLRELYNAYLVADPKFTEVGGEELLTIKQNNIAAFDFIVGTGQSQQQQPGAPPR